MTSTLGDRTEIELGMSNCDWSIDPGLAEALQAGNVYGTHSAYHFHGYVYWHNGMFHEEVHRHGRPVAVISAATLEDVRDAVNEQYGSD